MSRLRQTARLGARCVTYALIGWFYLWTAIPEWDHPLISPNADGYYSLLTRGMAKGHLYLDVPADPFLASLPDAADPSARAGHGMHDASYFRGHYYLYFGVTPVVVLLLPFRLLTGNLIDESLVSPIFCFIGFLFSALLIRQIHRRYFAQVAEGWVLAGEWALGWATLVPLLLRRVSVWEVPIACGYACCMVGLFALFRCGQRRNRTLWLAVASAAFGLAVGSRPTYLFGGVALLVPLVQEAWERRLRFRAWRDREWLRLAVAALAPICAIGMGLALYNLLRFGSPTEFGFRYLMNGFRMADERLFSWTFLWYNLRVYLFAPCGWSHYFPFVATASLPPLPPGHLGVEDPYGVIPNVPFALLGLIPMGWLAFRPSPARQGLRWFIWSAALTAFGTGAAVSAFGGAINRYMVDFVPTLIVLAVIGLFWVAARGREARLGRIAFRSFAVLALAYSVVFNVLASAGHNQLFREDHPAIYRRVAHRWNYLSYLLDRWRGAAYGPIEMTVVFPLGRVGEVEPLVATGRSFWSDYLYVHYLSVDTLRFGLSHTSQAGLLSEAVRVSPGVPHTLRIDLGSLYPPAADPYFDGLSPKEARLRQTLVRVTCDGRTVLDRQSEVYDAVSDQPSVGMSGERPAFLRPFSGQIISWRRLTQAPLAPAASTYGPIRLRAVLPAFSGRHNEPLLSLGETGAGDLVYIRYESPTSISVGYDHWGVGGRVTGSLRVDPKATQIFEIDSAALEEFPEGAPKFGVARRGRLIIRLNGVEVLREIAPYYVCDPGTVTTGLNSIRSSTSQALFTGQLLGIERLKQPRSDAN